MNLVLQIDIPERHMRQNVFAAGLTFFIFLKLAFANNVDLVQQIRVGTVQSASSSLVVIQNNQTLYSYFKDGTDHFQNVQSASKSVAAIGIEILIQQGKISSLDLPMSTWIPKWYTDSQKSKITLRMILNHTAGFPGDDKPCYLGGVQDVIAACESVPLVSSPGTQFLYSSNGSTLIGLVIAQASGQSVTDFFNQNLFNPMGIGNRFWNKDPAGHELVAGGLNLKTSDMIKLAQLMLNAGTLDGKLILTKSAVTNLLTKSQPFANYGLLWWLEQPGIGPGRSADSSLLQIYYAYGYGGQFIIVWPAKDLIVVRTRNPQTLVTNPKPTPAAWDEEQFYSLLKIVAQWQ